MTLLVLETATRRVGVAIIEGPARVAVGDAVLPSAGGKEDRLLVQLEAEGLRPHGNDLPALVQQALAKTGVRLQQLDGVVVDIGPGSFAGLRIGVAYAKGVAMGAKLPIATSCSLDVIAANASREANGICPIMDAKQQKVYSARYVYRGPREYRQSPALLTIQDVVARCPAASATLFLGDAIPAYRDVLTAALGERAQFAPESQWYPCVEAAARLGIVAFRAGKRVDPATLVPMYLYPWDCSIKGGTGTTETLPHPPHIEVHE